MFKIILRVFSLVVLLNQPFNANATEEKEEIP